jgi:hypothetical protein
MIRLDESFRIRRIDVERIQVRANLLDGLEILHERCTCFEYGAFRTQRVSWYFFGVGGGHGHGANMGSTLASLLRTPPRSCFYTTGDVT